MRINAKWLIILLITIVLLGCEATPSLYSGNLSFEEISATAPAKDKVIVSVTVFNGNKNKGKVIVGVVVNCGTVTVRVKKKILKISPNAKSTVTFEFKGVRDRIPTMAKTFQYQARIYNSRGRKLKESAYYTGTKPYGRPD